MPEVFFMCSNFIVNGMTFVIKFLDNLIIYQNISHKSHYKCIYAQLAWLRCATFEIGGGLSRPTGGHSGWNVTRNDEFCMGIHIRRLFMALVREAFYGWHEEFSCSW